MIHQEAAVVATALSKEFAGRFAVQEVAVELSAGSRTAIVGPNGSGKTTLMHMMAGLLRPTSGEVYIRGLPIEDPRTRSLVGIAPDDLPLPATLTGFEVLDLALRLRGDDPVIDLVQLIDLMELTEALHRPVGDYSHGMKRKLQLAAAVMHGPAVLFLDEPYRGLDPMSEILLRTIIATLADRGTSVVTCTHSLAITDDDYDNLLVMCDGRLVAAGHLVSLLEAHRAATVRDLFLTVTGRAGLVERNAVAVQRVFDGLDAGALSS